MANFVNVIISGNSKPLRAAIDKATLSMTGFQKKVALGFVAAGAASMAFAVSAVKAAAKDQVAMAELERQIKASTGATEEQIHAQEQFLKSVGRASAFSKSQLIPGYQALIVATRDAAKAQDIMSTAVNVARARHLDLTTVSEALAKGYAGNTRALRALSPEIKKLIADGATFDQVLVRLNQNFGGAASDYAKTFQGRLDILGNSVGALKKSIGLALLPVVEKLVPVLQAVVDTLAKHPTLVKILAIGIGALAGAFAIATTAVVAWTVASKAAAIGNAILSASFLGVEASTGVGIAVALAAAAAITKLTFTVVNGVKAQYDYNDAIQQSTELMGNEERMARYVHDQELDRIAEEEKARVAAEEAKKKAMDDAKAAEKRRYDDFISRLKDAKKAIREYVNAIADQISRTVSLSSAFSDAASAQSEADNAVKTALEARAQAYEELNQAQATNDVKAYAEALKKVADTEKAVNEAQAVKPKSYLELFREQITAAKEFAGNLKTLIGQGIGKAGLQQLLDLGPVAGNAVAKDLIAGVGGYTAASLKADLAAVQEAAGQVGLAIPGVSTALTATGSKTASNTYQITVNAGVGDKVEIAKQVVDVLQAYEKRLGGIPIKVK